MNAQAPALRRPFSVSDDERFMQAALRLGRRGLGRTWPNPAVGAIIVAEAGQEPVIVGRGWTQPGGVPHAEVEALRRAGAAARGSTLYVTLEPCAHHGRSPPCADALIAAGIRRVVSSVEDPNPLVAGAGHARLRAAGVAVEVGVAAEAARRDHAGHFRRVRDGRPQITLKLALSADEKAGLPGRRPAAITGDAARARAHLLRAQHDAILIGIGTALADDPLLTCRLPGMDDRTPVRVVLDTRLRLPARSRLVATARTAPLWVMTTSEAAISPAADALRAAGAVVLAAVAGHGPLDLPGVIAALAQRGVTRVLVEGGPIVAAAFVSAGLVDEALVFRSSQAIGEGGIEALEGLPFSALTANSGLALCGCEAVGPDTLEILRRG